MPIIGEQVTCQIYKLILNIFTDQIFSCKKKNKLFVSFTNSSNILQCIQNAIFFKLISYV